ncbi:MAG: cytidine deaminase [Gammaproteobacteria bacterium]
MIKEKMFKAALMVRDKSYAPFSKFNVGASILTDGDQIFSGCNVENSSYGNTLCAEASAISAMIAGGFSSIKAILVTSGSSDKYCYPCGACLQKISEFSNDETIVYLALSNGCIKELLLSKLIPYAFKIRDFLC